MGASLIQGFLKSTAMTIVSEIGDKTFFVAALMAMRHPRGVVLTGALLALVVMTIFSAVFGWAAPNLISRKLTHNGATFLFFVFGLRSLWDAISNEEGESELAEVEAKLGRTDDIKKKKKQQASVFLSPVLIEAFSLTFLGEWGDRSQIATIGLAAQENVVGVAVGGFLGHALCTSAAVWGGKHLASSISERSVALCGGILFLLFGAHSLFNGFQVA
ncbi:GDT1-like protein 5 isoform X3 [Selaginella moellendorffii]|uniref:GDT1-like protein 5 isoform X3 n=1 Tax=Selaginella moellendorffii TaxID=88036 RepID=UPI000D1C99DC|nr:GDT1-like protein 5 isoform X3 [Selaginella moellendorffii]|eukprot:XP_024530983.1 GDT1-like protein 5 isoform X3 [Selaginella moellendorffii]